jgi:hypothetical protein
LQQKSVPQSERFFDKPYKWRKCMGIEPISTPITH